MKYIKQFEIVGEYHHSFNKYKIGDYVLIAEQGYFNTAFNNYLKTTIGKILDTKIRNKIPLKIKVFIKLEEDMFYGFRGEKHKYDNPSWFDDFEILHVSSNREELELIAQANKYNL